MDEIKQLENELRVLREKRQTQEKVKQLKNQIKQEKFNQTKTGKFFNAVGRVFDNMGGGTKQTPQKKPKTKVVKTKSVEEVMSGIDDALNQFNKY